MKIFSNVQKTRAFSTAQYREWAKKENRPFLYHPITHLYGNLLMLISVIGVQLFFIQSFSWWMLAVAGFVFLLGNIVVWTVHKYPLHRRYRYWSYPFDAHTIQHHRYFTYEAITYDSIADYQAIFFPTEVIAGFSFIAQPIFYFGLSPLIGSDLAHFFGACAAGYFLLYEFFHWASHQSESHFLMKLGWINYMREHHRIHHNMKLMGRYNFCIVYPMMDFIMGTKFQGSLVQEKADDHFNDVKQYFGEK